DGRRWLLDRYTVSYVTSGRDLLRERSPLDTPGEPVALAVTRYADPSWNLPGLTTQADLLPRLVPGIRVLRDEAATEAALRNVSAPRILHIAAHGVFLGDGAGSAMQRGRLILADALPTPETREARVPTPATRDDGNDGVATAAELLTMNLRGTRLVVLSACETAQGSAAVGQGVFGLRRAFLLAGAEALVTTQWDVDERAGAVFTVALYEGLRAGMRSADAVARAARVVRERDPDPFAWAPFVLVGRDDTIDWASVPVRPAT
ncbi:MAG: hypothetical protein JWM10_4284, partial [Myxococcaceae bacterium]|nr:hypothetical protein [Myxococcaceae bacterium]